MIRRQFIALLGGAAAAWPFVASAQQSARLRTIGYLGSSTALAQSSWVAAFVRRLHELGWLEGQTVAIEYRWAEGRSERFAEIAAEFVRLKVDVIVTAGTAPALAAKQATSAIPIVFPLAGDPVGNGLVASLPRPGANVTGLSLQTTDIGAKRLEVLREVLPKLGSLAILANIGNAAAALEMSEVRDSARNLGLDITMLEVRRAEEIALAFQALGNRAEALIVCGDPLVTNNRVRIITLALGARLPTMHGSREHVEAGGLMSYGPNFPDLFRRSADYVDKILRGAKPSELPVEQPTKIDLAVNLITAKVLGLTIPQTVLARADEVIEWNRREIIRLLGGTVTWPLATITHVRRLLRNLAVQTIASVILFQSWAIVAAEEAAIPSDHNFVDELVSELGFQPTDLIERVRQLSNIPSEAAMQHRLSYCVEGYADRIATDANLREKVASEVEERTCAQLGLCQERGQQRIDQSSLYAELLRVVADEMRGEKRADTSKVFQEHEQFVEFGRHLARQSGVEETFRQASYVSAQVSARHIRESCPSLWNSWLVQVSALIGVGLLGLVLAVVYKRTGIKPAPT